MSVSEDLRDIICKRSDIDLKMYSNINKEQNLLGQEINLGHREILYIIHDIEAKYAITIPEEILLDANTYTINALCNVISKLKVE